MDLGAYGPKFILAMRIPFILNAGDKKIIDCSVLCHVKFIHRIIGSQKRVGDKFVCGSKIPDRILKQN